MSYNVKSSNGGKTVSIDVRSRDCCNGNHNREPDSTSKSFSEIDNETKKYHEICTKHSKSGRKTWLQILREENDAQISNKPIANESCCGNCAISSKHHCISNPTTLRTQNVVKSFNDLVSDVAKSLPTMQSNEDSMQILSEIERIRHLMTEKRNGNYTDSITSHNSCKLDGRVQYLEKNGFVNFHNLAAIQSSFPTSSEQSCVAYPKNVAYREEDIRNDVDIDPVAKDKYRYMMQLINNKRSELVEKVYAENMKVEMVQDMKKDIKHVVARTDSFDRSMKTVHKLLTDVTEQNKVISDMKDTKHELESRVKVLSCENRHLKDEVKRIKAENELANKALRKKDKDIKLLKQHILTIREMITGNMVPEAIGNDTLNSDSMMKLAEFLDSSIVIDERLVENDRRPISSSPMSSRKDSSKSNNDYDSGIQSNTPDKIKMKSKNDAIYTLKNNLKGILTDIRQELDVAYSHQRDDPDLNVSSFTYKCSLPSIIDDS